MARMLSADSAAEILDVDPHTVLDLARRSIAHGVEFGRSLSVDAATYALTLQQPRACFVTLKIRGALRGCMGCLEASQPLAEGIAHYAYQAAFHDPRFPGLEGRELPAIAISV